MKKKDLESGMLVQLGNDTFGLVVNDALIDRIGYFNLEYFNEDLTHTAGSQYNINKVSKVLSMNHLRIDKWNSHTLNKFLLWEREVVNEFTIEELEKLTGLKNIKIKK